MCIGPSTKEPHGPARLAIVKQITAAMHVLEGLEKEGELQDNHWRLLLDWHILCSSDLLKEGPDWMGMNVKYSVCQRDFWGFRQLRGEGKKQ